MQAVAHPRIRPGGAQAEAIDVGQLHALARGAVIWCEALGGAANCGAQTQGGSMTAQNPAAVRDCLRAALHAAGREPTDVDAISGHLTATGADSAEIGTRFEVKEFEVVLLPEQP